MPAPSHAGPGRAARLLLSLLLLGHGLGATGAQIDFVADAVVGKPTLATPSGGAVSATNVASPVALAEDPVTGALWVADGGNRVLRFSSAASFANGEAANLVLGQADFVSTQANRGGAATAATLSLPFGVAVNQAGHLFVSDGSNHRILVFRPPFTNGMNASEVIGQADFTGANANRGGAIGQSTLSGPRGIALDSRGALFVADQGNNRVLRYLPPSFMDATAGKVFGQAGFGTATLATTATGLASPLGVHVDPQDHLWVADSGNRRVLRYDAGALDGDATADLVLCQASFLTSTAGTTANTCSTTTSVAVDLEGLVYLTDFSNNRILRFTTLTIGASAAAVIGQPDFTSVACNQATGAPGASTLCNPQAALLDRTGNLLVADRTNGRVLRYDLPRARVAPFIFTTSPEAFPPGPGGFTLTVNGGSFYGNSVVQWNGSPRPTQYLSDRRLLAQLAPGDVASAGPHLVSVANPAPGGGLAPSVGLATYARAPLDGNADRVLGQPNLASNTALNSRVGEEQVGALNAAVFSPSTLKHVAVDALTGRLFAVDSASGSRVLSWPSAAAFHNGQAADVVLGKPDEFTGGCSIAGNLAATLCGPYGIAVDAAGALYVAEEPGNRILKFTPPFTTGMAASAVLGQAGSFTSTTANLGGRSASSLASPSALAIFGKTLFVLDSGNRRVLVFNDPDASAAANVVIGQNDMVSALGAAASASRFGISLGGLAVDASGRLHVAIVGEHRILRFSPPFTNGMAADVVIGQPDFVSVTAATTAARLSAPLGLAFDPAGNLLVADSNNRRVLRYAAPLSTAMLATGVLGQSDFVTNTVGSTASKLNAPTGLALDNVGNLYVADAGNSRIVAFDRPFAFAIDPAGDTDRDGIPNGIEAGEARDPFTKDNDVFGNTRLFAMQQYRDFLSREGDSGGIAFWIAQLAGPQTRAQAIQGFFNSPEFQGVIAPVARLYFANFLRYPDYVGLQFHVARSRTGTPLATIANDFATSPEFISRYGALTNDAFIELVYNNVLGRPSDPVGKAYWLAQMSGGATRGQVMLGFSESPEYVAAIGNEVFITMMYVGMLRRAPDPVGFPFWLTQLDGGTSSLALTQGFLDAPEYRGRFLP